MPYKENPSEGAADGKKSKKLIKWVYKKAERIGKIHWLTPESKSHEGANVADKAAEATENDHKPVDQPAQKDLTTDTWVPGSTVKPADASPPIPAGFPAAPLIHGEASKADQKPFDAKAAAADIQDALHVPFFSTRIFPDADRVVNKMLNMSPQEYKAVEAEYNKNIAPGEKPYFSGDKKWTLEDDVKRQLTGTDELVVTKLMESKAHNDVPPEHRVNGEQLLKPGSPLKVGELNPVTMADGRRYDVYVPKNADNRAPVIVAMHGAAGGDSVGLMAQESGLTADAERTGATVVFAYPKPRDFDIGVSNVQGVAWNVPGRINLPKAEDKVTDDRKYMDNVLDDLKGKTQMADKVGLFGFSDGGRFAQVYAADRPDRVAAVVSHDGTWMKGDQTPTVGKPMMIIHGDKDETLPYAGGMGSVSRKMDWLLGTNLDKSAPYMQAEVWKKADQCDGPVKVNDGKDVLTRDYTGCKVGEVKEYIVKGGEHGINDFKNGGSRTVQWMLGSADRRQAYATEGAAFLKRWIVSDPGIKRSE